MSSKKPRARGRPKSAEARKAFQVLLLKAEKKKLKRASKREGFRSLSAWIASTSLQRAEKVNANG